MAKNYPLYWLDNFINNTLHPENLSKDSLLKICSDNTQRQIKLEVSSIKSKIKDRTFSMQKEPQLRLYINNLYRSLEVLLSQLEQYKKFKEYQDPIPIKILDNLHYEITGLCSFIDLWYPNYLHKTETSSLGKEQGYSRKFSEKIKCNLTGDQAALVLRAADDSKFLVARSMRSVFRAIVPYLSTTQRKNLSYDSLRLKAYIISDKDKEIAIKRLKLMIKKIESY